MLSKHDSKNEPQQRRILFGRSEQEINARLRKHSEKCAFPRQSCSPRINRFSFDGWSIQQKKLFSSIKLRRVPITDLKPRSDVSSGGKGDSPQDFSHQSQGPIHQIQSLHSHR